MKKLIIVSIAVISLFADIKTSQNAQNTLEYQWFSSAIAGTCAESTADACGSRDQNDEYQGDNCRACTATGGGGGSTGTGGGGRSGSGGSRGNTDENRDNQEERQETEQEPPQNRAQCIAESVDVQNKCNARPLLMHTSRLRQCNNHDFTVSGGASSGSALRLILDARGDVSVTVRTYDACKDINDSVRDGLLNDCKIGHSSRVLKCPAE